MGLISMSPHKYYLDDLLILNWKTVEVWRGRPMHITGTSIWIY